MLQSIWASALDICIYDKLKLQHYVGKFSSTKPATFKAEVQFEKRDMARSINYPYPRCLFDSLFCRKTEGVESDAPE
jgi:hypothetical protein